MAQNALAETVTFGLILTIMLEVKTIEWGRMIFVGDEKRLVVARMSFITGENCNYEDIFKGFDELYAITYSYSLGFISKIMAWFQTGEVILGFEKLLNAPVAELFAIQQYSVDYIAKHAELQNRIQNDEFRFYVLSKSVSHQKVYLLKARDGRCRVILASANFSGVAWNGMQRENFVVCDDAVCFDFYMAQYIELRDSSSDMIGKQVVPVTEDGANLDVLPICKRLKKEGAVVIDMKDQTDDVEYGFFMKKATGMTQEKLREAKLVPDKNGKILITSEKTTKLFQSLKKSADLQKTKALEYPQFVLNYADGSAVYNGHAIDLHPADEDIRRDIQGLLDYMQGFDSFVGDTERMKLMYWKVLNYMFVSPFLARLRYEADLAGHDLRFFPMYLLISGDSDAGKTAFVELVYKLMFDCGLRPLSQKYFTTERMAVIKDNCKGCPVVIDELTTLYWKYAENIVKFDSSLLDDKNINHPCFVLISNKLNGIKPEITKRVIVINPDCRLDRDAAASNGRKIKSIVRGVGNALYGEYLSRMFCQVDDLIDGLSDENQIPDIWAVSTGILMDILDEYGFISCFVRQTWQDYIGERAVAEKALMIIQTEYAQNSAAFVVDRKHNRLYIDFEKHDSKQGQKLVDILLNELPAPCECRKLGAKVNLNLEETERYTGLKFKKSLFWRRGRLGN